MEQAPVRTMPLPVKLNAGELALRAQELATAEGALGENEIKLDNFVEEAKATKGTMQSDIDKARAEVRRLARIVRDRQEDREIPIAEDLDYEAGAVNTVRTDTGEIVATRGMTPEERQRNLFVRGGKRSKES